MEKIRYTNDQALEEFEAGKITLMDLLKDAHVHKGSGWDIIIRIVIG